MVRILSTARIRVKAPKSLLGQRGKELLLLSQVPKSRRPIHALVGSHQDAHSSRDDRTLSSTLLRRTVDRKLLHATTGTEIEEAISTSPAERQLPSIIVHQPSSIIVLTHNMGFSDAPKFWASLKSFASGWFCKWGKAKFAQHGLPRHFDTIGGG